MAIATLIVVPARAGSKGLPDKNIRMLGDRPLLAWTARTIAEAGLPDCLSILSTDSEQYAEIGRQFDLPAPFIRPAACATDAASALQVAQHALAWFRDQYGYLPERLMWLQPTSPFRSPESLRQAARMVAEADVDAVVGCKEIHRDPTTLFRADDGYLTPLDSRQATQTSRQQSRPLLTPNGAMYLCPSEYLLARLSFYPPNTRPLIMNAVQSLDIDTEEDWAIAEAFIQQGLV